MTAPRVIAYTRVSTQEQAYSGLGLAAQREALAVEFQRRGWVRVEWIEDAGYSARTLKRPGMASALAKLRTGEADVLAVAKMDRCSRSLLDFATLMEEARTSRPGWALLALDSPVDLLTPQGEAMAGVQAVFATLERRLASERTKAALAARKAAGHRLGRAPVIGDDVAALAGMLAGEGYGLRAIARGLAAAGHTPPNGRTWHHRTVGKLLERPAALAAREEAAQVAA